MNKFILSSTLTLILFISCKESGKKISTEKNDSSVPEVVYLSKSQLDHVIDTNNIDGNSVPSFGVPRIIGYGQQGEPYYLIKRTVTGEVQMHEQWDDIVIIRSGHGTLITGRKVNGDMREEDEKPWRNWTGGIIQDKKEQPLSPGDFVIIPAMTAHQYIPANNDTLTYWTIKIKRMNKNLAP